MKDSFVRAIFVILGVSIGVRAAADLLAPILGWLVVLLAIGLFLAKALSRR